MKSSTLLLLGTSQNWETWDRLKATISMCFYWFYIILYLESADDLADITVFPYRFLHFQSFWFHNEDGKHFLRIWQPKPKLWKHFCKERHPCVPHQIATRIENEFYDSIRYLYRYMAKQNTVFRRKSAKTSLCKSIKRTLSELAEIFSVGSTSIFLNK